MQRRAVAPATELHPEIVHRSEWMQGLACGDLSLSISMPGFGNYGSPTDPWVFIDRALPFHVVHLPLKGRIRLRIGGAETIVEPGSFLWISPGVMHDMSRTDTRAPVTMYHVRAVVRRRDGTPCRMPEDAIVLPHALAIHRLFEVWFTERAQDEEHAAAIGAGLFLQTFGYLFGGLSKSGGGRRLTSAQQKALRRYLDTEAGRSPSPADLAARLGLSPIYFSRLFKATFGASPKTWLAEEKMRRACVQLTETKHSITAIGESLGYADVYSFSRQFARSIGCSPRRFRGLHSSPR
jgi:AraC-like DNA-binding protein